VTAPVEENLHAEVIVSPQFDPAAIPDVLHLFRRLGLDAEIAPPPVLRSGDLTWLVLASLPLVGFLSALGDKIADDGYAELRELVVRIARHGRRTGATTHALLLEDEGTGTLVELDEDLPDESYRRLLEVDLSANAGVTLRYEAATGHWTAVLEPGSVADGGARKRKTGRND
jgi:hypothetical protein